MKFLDTNVQPLGMGCWVIGGPFFSGDTPLGFGEVDDAESIRTIHAALDAGIQVFDTAAAYGAGRGERVVGQALKARDNAIVISKIGLAIDEENRQLLGEDTDPDRVENAIDQSLHRLQRDVVDVMLLHVNKLPFEKAEPLFAAMERTRQKGKVRAFGWSTDFPESVRAMATMDGFQCVEHAMNVFLDVPTIQAVTRGCGLTALIRSPLAMGVLTGKFASGITLPADDHRSTKNDYHDYFHNGRPARHHAKNMEAIRDILSSGGRTPTQGALSWLLAKSDHNLPVPGARTVKQVEENAGALSFGPLPKDAMEEIERIIPRKPEGEPRAR